MYIVSKCLLGYNCKYNGGNNRNEEVLEFCKNKSIVAVCPEEAGGLKSPRPPAEIIDNLVIDKVGEDLTDAFTKGAEISLKYALDKNETIEGAILKANSPSCGAGTIYDGTFSHVKVKGDGMFARRLRDIGIDLMTEEDFK